MKKMEIDISKKYICQGLINFTNSTENPTQQGFAVEYARAGFRIFPCDVMKAPIVNHSLGFVHGFYDGIANIRLIAKTWFRYPDAAIGFTIPDDIIVFDCDVRKDAEKKPILKDGKPEVIGLESLKDLAAKLNLKDADLDTLSVRTQSGGRHFYYRMPEGVPSFNHTHALEGLDLKGYGGYVILPNSPGQYGRYEFLNLNEIRFIPEVILNWIPKFKANNVSFKQTPTGKNKINREALVELLTYDWKKGDGKRNRLMMAIAGSIARAGGTEEDATYVISELCRLTGKGYDHIPGAKYAFHRNGSIWGFSTLEKIMEEIEND